MGLIASIVGATGLVGSHLLTLLLEDARVDRVQVFTRRTTGRESARLIEHICELSDLPSWADKLQGDVLFSALGTTLKKAGSKEAQYLVDFTYQFEVAKAASERGVSRYGLVSSTGADARSRLFYPRIKGELENAVKALSFDRVAVVQPSVLEGDRAESRPGERVGAVMAKALAFVPVLRRYRPVHAKTVARALTAITLAEGDDRFVVLPADDIHAYRQASVNELPVSND